MQEILDFLQSLDWSPLVISIKTGIVATILSFFFGIFAARAVMKLRPGARAVIDGFLTLPMILPPTVAGFFLLLILALHCMRISVSRQYRHGLAVFWRQRLSRFR